MAKKEEKCCEKTEPSTQCSAPFKVPADVPPVSGCKPCGSSVLLELLTVQEMMGTKLFLKNDTNSQPEYHAYVLAIGPALDPRPYGFKVGDRVLLSGSGTPIPNFDNCERERILMEPYCIKAVLS
jgi:hypothetical protein